MAISITLNHEITTTEKGIVKLRLYTTATDISNKVFAIEVLPRSADQLAALYRFSHICSPAELNELPDDAPGDNCYYRISDITMLFDTPVTADLVLKHVKADIKTLVAEYKKLQSYTAETGTETFS